MGRAPMAQPPGMETRARSHARDQRPEHEGGSAHGFDQIVAGFRTRQLAAADDGAMLGAAVAEFDLGAHGGEQLALGFNVAHLGNVFEDDRLFGENGGGHGRQRGVFGAADANRPEQGITTANYKLIHYLNSWSDERFAGTAWLIVSGTGRRRARIRQRSPIRQAGCPE